jgi:hypothetical protein
MGIRSRDCGVEHQLIALNGRDDYIETYALKNAPSSRRAR